MAERNREKERARSIKIDKNRLRLIIIIVIILFLCLFFYFTRQYLSVDDKLAAIDSARAIDDSENAAIIYNQLLDKYDKSAFTSLPIDQNDVALREPWHSKDSPELEKWFNERQEIITDLLQVLNIEKCRFPIPNSVDSFSATSERLSIIRQWAYFLARSANNDIAEGRIEQALEKHFCLIRMGRHNRQQPVAIDFLVGIAVESLALQKMRFCILESDLTEEHLWKIEKALSQPEDEQKLQLDNMVEVENLYMRKAPFLERLKEWIRNLRSQTDIFIKINEIHTRFLADRRGTEILIALRRNKNKTGRWPESLDEIKSLVAENTLVDPTNNGSFVYKLSGNDFILYSKGPNNIDEAGRYRNGADDRAIWPAKIPQAKEQNSEAEPSNQEKIE